jgi:SAM-dependent methyltransferase
MSFLKKFLGVSQSLESAKVVQPYSRDLPFNRPIVTSKSSRGELIERYWSSHPRFQYFKQAPANASLLDVGCGPGGLSAWKRWLEPTRSDLKLYGIDLAAGEHVSKYEGFQIVNLDIQAIPFEGVSFDAAIASHLLEHVQQPERLMRGVFDRLRPGGTFYVEVPHPRARGLPRAEEFRARGWPMMISNFFDDATHLETPTPQQMSQWAKGCGFDIITTADIQSELHNELIAYGVENNDQEALLYGYWAATGWAYYCVLRKPL